MAENALTYRVEGMTCNSCRLTIIEELQELDSVDAVDVDLDSKQVTVRGTHLVDDDVREAIVEAGYEPARA